MGPRQRPVIGAMLLRKVAKRRMHAVIRGISMGKAVHGVVTMAEGHDRRRRHEAKRREGGNRHRHAEAKPGAECPQHASSLVGRGASRNLATDHKLRYQPPIMGKPANPGARALVADIGGTNARFALADLETLELSEIRQFPCAEHASIEAAAEIYLAGLKERPCRGAVAVAAPLAGGKIKLTNSAWSFTAESLASAANLDDILLLNDFEALSLSLPHLRAEELH